MASTSSHSQEAQKEVMKQAKGADTKTAEGETTKKPGHVEQDPDGEDPEVLAIAKEDAERAAAMADAVASWWQRHRRQRGLLLTLTVCFSGVQ
ncbi:unnamed protein product [Durusdinium trenchii]|uniref:Uncharacterized protein n=1 Tax=Durusdinium trenchii TaxID=1381693 RepID=A0ABP0NC29_9DINO